MLTALLFAAQAGPTAGVNVTVKVVDGEGQPVASAQIRHPEERERHRVNVEDGSWTGDAVYLADGKEVVFTKKLLLPLEVSAPGFETTTVELVVHKKAAKNVLQVKLVPLAIEVDTSASDGGPSIGFKHDKPRE